MPAGDFDRIKKAIDKLSFAVVDLSIDDDTESVNQILTGLLPFLNDDELWLFKYIVDDTLAKTVEQSAQHLEHTLSNALLHLQSLVDMYSDSASCHDPEVLRRIKESFEGAASGLSRQDRTDDLQVFVDNALSELNEYEFAVLQLSASEDADAIVKEILRIVHTLKGESGLVGQTQCSLLAHSLESFIASIQGQPQRLDDSVSSLLEAKDLFKKMVLSLIGQESMVAQDEYERVLSLLTVQKSPGPQPPVLDFSVETDMLVDFIVEAREHMGSAEEALLGLENDKTNSDFINKLFRAFHTIKGVAGFLNLHDIKILTHETETMLDQVRDNSLQISEAVMEAVLASIDMTRTLLDLLEEQISSGGRLSSEYPDIHIVTQRIISIIGEENSATVNRRSRKFIGEILVEKNVIDNGTLDEALLTQKEKKDGHKIGEILVDMGAATDRQIKDGLKEQKKTVHIEDTVKIGVNKLDSLMDLMGELVISGAQVIQNRTIIDSDDQKLNKDLAELSRIIRDIQSISMSMRLVPIRPIFQKMVRLIRDIARKVGKEIDIELSGEATEIDKNLVELLADPLMHMVRNSVDHGIETAQQRVAKGKTRKGHVRLDAYHKSGNIVIELSDDGAGLNKERIIEKAVQNGIFAADDIYSMPDNKIYHLIFEPGFSTAEQVTDVSGRGVGMDVVRKNIERMRGKIDIETHKDRGTTFYIKLPLTLAIIDGIVTRVGAVCYIIPTYSVIRFVCPRADMINMLPDGSSVINVDRRVYPFIALSKCFRVKGDTDDFEKMTACLVEHDEGIACFAVDELMGKTQVVIKSLGDSFRHVTGLAGAAIMGDGRTALIVDVNGIIEHTAYSVC